MKIIWNSDFPGLLGHSDARSFSCVCSQRQLTRCFRDHIKVKTKIPLAFYRKWFADPWPVLFRMMPEAQGFFWSGIHPLKEDPVTWILLEASLSPSQNGGCPSWLQSSTPGELLKSMSSRPRLFKWECWNQGLGKRIFGKLRRCFWGAAKAESCVRENGVTPRCLGAAVLLKL